MNIHATIKTISAACCFVLLFACKTGTKPTGSHSNVPHLPANWKHIDSAGAVILGKNAYNRNGKSTIDFVVVVNLSAGGGMRILDSIYKNDNCSPVFNSYPVTGTSGNTFWKLFSNNNSFAMANLQFYNFRTAETDTAQVCYPVYFNGKYISQGCADGTCSADQRLPKRIMIFTDTITVLEYPIYIPCSNDAMPAQSTAAIVGNHPLANRDSSRYVARTYMAKQGTNLVVYTSPYAKDADIYSVLQKEFNIAPGNIVMFDGSGSTQMICKGITYVPSSDNRRVPSAIEIYCN